MTVHLPTTHLNSVCIRERERERERVAYNALEEHVYKREREREREKLVEAERRSERKSEWDVNYNGKCIDYTRRASLKQIIQNEIQNWRDPPLRIRTQLSLSRFFGQFCRLLNLYIFLLYT